MHLYESYITEVLDTKTQVNLIKNTKTKFQTELKLKDSKIVFLAGLNDEEWHVVFWSDGPKGRTFNLTGDGEPLKVMSFVVQSFEQFLDQKKPDWVVFTADKDTRNDSRAKVYEKIGNRLSTKKKYDFSKQQSSNGVEFHLVRKQGEE